jgi:1-deoxy-D-xylulose-5-phosphate reductoisomerase
MNAANEMAVMSFLDGHVPLTRIGEVVSAVVDEHEAAPVVSLVSLERADAWARRRASELLAERPA